jgi:hypothetical protein
MAFSSSVGSILWFDAEFPLIGPTRFPGMGTS